MANRSGRRLVLTTLLLMVPCSIAAINLSLTNQDVERALRIGRGSEKDRAAFHRRYIRTPSNPTIRQLEIATEFRRYVLKTEERARLGDWMFSQGVRQARETLAPVRGRLLIIAHVQFDPLNTYSQVPSFLLVVGGTPDVAPLEARITPMSSFPYQANGRLTTFLTGAALESEFDAAPLARSMRPVSVFLDGKELARVTIDFDELE